MSWTRLDDLWTDSSFFDDLSFPDRWHYLAMIQFCSRTGKFDGRIRLVDAKRCSDHPDPTQALSNLESAELVQGMGSTVRVLKIEDHIPPPSVRNKQEDDRKRKQRQRKHKEGDHSMCLTEHCENAPLPKEGSDVTRDKGSDPRTGQDRTGQEGGTPVLPENSVDLETGEVSENFDTSDAEDASVLNATPDWWDQQIAAAGTDAQKLTKVGKALKTEFPDDPRLPDLRRRVEAATSTKSEPSRPDPEILDMLRARQQA